MQRAIELFDSTLRDGAQGEGISLSVEDKLAITRLLDSLGVAYIEAGNPASNPKDMEYFQKIEKMTFAHATIVAFGSTRRKGIKAAQDANVQALLQANAPVCCIFGKSWRLHVTEILGTTPQENFAMIGDTVRYIKENGKQVFFDAEHSSTAIRTIRRLPWQRCRQQRTQAQNAWFCATPTAAPSPMRLEKLPARW